MKKFKSFIAPKSEKDKDASVMSDDLSSIDQDTSGLNKAFQGFPDDIKNGERCSKF